MQLGPLDQNRFAYWTGSDLRKLRVHFKWSQEKCAQMVFGVSRSTFNGWENDMDVLPRVVRLAMIGAFASGRMAGGGS